PVPSTLIGQVDAAIGGKTAIDLPEGKNLVGAFHWPARTIIDPALLETLPEREQRQGRAELVKTSLLAGRELDVRTAAARATSSTSDTRSRTRSRPLRGTSSHTATPSPSACSPPSGSPPTTKASEPSSESSRRGPFASTPSAPGRRSSETR